MLSLTDIGDSRAYIPQYNPLDIPKRVFSNSRSLSSRKADPDRLETYEQRCKDHQKTGRWSVKDLERGGLLLFRQESESLEIRLLIAYHDPAFNRLKVRTMMIWLM